MAHMEMLEHLVLFVTTCAVSKSLLTSQHDGLLAILVAGQPNRDYSAFTQEWPTSFFQRIMVNDVTKEVQTCTKGFSDA